MFKKIAGLALTGSLALSMVVPFNTYASDIEGHQMVNELTYWANKDVILPDSKGNFNPNRAVTRGEFASYIARAFDLPESSKYTFSDMKQGTRLTREIQAAAGANILSGYPDGTFKPDEKITRQQMAGMLYKALRYLDVPLKEDTMEFKDEAKIHLSFTDAVATNVYYSIIRGDHTANGVYFKPKESATIAHASAFLYRMNSVVDRYTPEDEVEKEEPIEEEVVIDTNYYIGKVSKGVVTKESKKYTSYDQALNAYENSNGANLIFEGDKIVKMTSGIAYAADTTGNTTSIYKNRNFTNQITYITEGRELKYIGSNDDYAIVQVGDIQGYVKLSDVELVPTSLIEKRDEYSVTDGLLNHRIYNHVTGKSEGFYAVGPAPDFLKSGATYYSFDGVHFYNSSDKLVGTYFPYFQFASVRQLSNYTAEELDQIIERELAIRESMGATYKDATKKSKLLGLGSFIKEMEEKHHVNALFILATAMHESNFGMSTKAQTINNLFGIRVIDSDEENTGDKYNTPKKSVEAFINEYINKNYVPQTGNYPFGASPGNKNTGINVYYASDPHWGAKIAGHMYRMDTKYGQKDYGQSKIGMIYTEGGYVNTRVEPSTNSAIAYQYKVKANGELGDFGYPVIIVDETKASDGYVWYKIYSDANPPAEEFVWIRSDLIEVLPEY